MRVAILSLFASREVRASLRSRWLLVGAVSFGVLAVAVSRLGIGNAQAWGVSAIDRTSAALLNLVLLFVPLLTLPLGASAFAGELEDGTLPYLAAQPVTRAEVYAGKLLGLLGATTLALLLGFGVAALWLGARGGMSAGSFAALAGGAWCVGVATTSIGALIAVAARTRTRALAAAIAAWLALVFLCDFGVLALAASCALGPNALFAAAVANPLQAAKTLSALAITDRLEILGPAGVHAVRAFGRAELAALLAASIGAWTVASSAAGFLIFRREPLT